MRLPMFSILLCLPSMVLANDCTVTHMGNIDIIDCSNGYHGTVTHMGNIDTYNDNTGATGGALRQKNSNTETWNVITPNKSNPNYGSKLQTTIVPKGEAPIPNKKKKPLYDDPLEIDY